MDEDTTKVSVQLTPAETISADIDPGELVQLPHNHNVDDRGEENSEQVDEHPLAENVPTIVTTAVQDEDHLKNNNKSQQIDSLEAAMVKEENFVIFHCISYLGAASIKESKSELEIQRLMSFMNEQSVANAIQVSVSVPLHSNGDVIVYEEENQEEISRFKINQIIFFARGVAGTPDSACFAFTSSHGENHQNSLFQCHAFRCDVHEAVDRVFQSFARAFESPPKGMIPHHPNTSHIVESAELKAQENTVFEVSLEIKEDDGKGNYNAIPRDKGYFKLRSGIPKQIVLTVQQIPDLSKEYLIEFVVERCFGILLSPGRHVRHSDMQLVEMLSWSIGSSDRAKSYVIAGQWDSNDPAFEVLNQETSKESGVFFTVAVDLVIKGIQEPIRFALETKGKVYPASERFWMIGRKHHYTQQFALSLTRVEDVTPGGSKFKVLHIAPLGEVDKNKINFNLNFTSFIRSSSIGSMEMDTPNKEDEEESDDDQPMQSGVGEVSKECSDEQVRAWSGILADWSSSSERPKTLAALVRAGIPDTLRGEIWQRLGCSFNNPFPDKSECHNEEDMMNKYRTLISKDCPNDDVILRDITRTFPANDYFKESGTGQELLYKISKSYALYDTDVGYCQGISFIAAALLLKMPEEQAFCLLVKIMYAYGFRDLYKDGFDSLHLKLYQLDRLLEDQVPELWAHFQELGIESHMFASQWFLTLYTAKFPLIFVFRVIDLFLLEGTKALFQVAVSLLAAARKDLLVLDFEGILKYFRVSLPKKYRHIENTNNLIRASVQTKVKKLRKYELEYLANKEQEKNYVDPLTRLSQEHKQLMEDKLRAEQTITNLVLSKSVTDETVEFLKEELKRTQTSLKEAEDFNQRLKEESDSVKELFQREVKQYDDEGEVMRREGEKKSSIISEYKRICSKLSCQLEEEQKLSRERMAFFQTNLCESCSAFVSTAMALVSRSSSTGGSSNGQRKTSPSPLGDRTGSPPFGLTSDSPEYYMQPLENELAKTKIALAESVCKNDDLTHQLSVVVAELEAMRNNSSGGGGGGAAWIWKNLSFNKEHKRHSTSSQDEPGMTASAFSNNGSSSTFSHMSSSNSMQNMSKE